jgi:hypothetical protein
MLSHVVRCVSPPSIRDKERKLHYAHVLIRPDVYCDREHRVVSIHRMVSRAAGKVTGSQLRRGLHGKLLGRVAASFYTVAEAIRKHIG